MSLAWALCDLTGARLGWFDQREAGSKVTINLNGHREAQVNLSLEDPIVRSVYPLARRLKVYLDHDLVFHGPITSAKAQGAARNILIGALGPTHQIAHQYIPWPSSWNPLPSGEVQALNLVQTEQAEIFQWLCLFAEPSSAFDGPTYASIPRIGLVAGSLPDSVLRDRSYEPGKNIWDALVQLSEVIDGPDFDFAPLDATNGDTAMYHVYPDGLGEDRSETVRFHYGFGYDNCRDFGYEPDGSGVTNDFTVSGQAEQGLEPPHYRSRQYDSLYAFGRWQGFLGRSDVNQDQTVEDIARDQVAAYAFPPDFFDVSPAVEYREAGYGLDPDGNLIGRLGIPPRVKQDYWIGDTVSVAGRIGEFEASGLGRVKQIVLAEDKLGNVVTDLEIAPRIFGTGVE